MRLLLPLVLLCLSSVPLAQAAPDTIYLVRHAEKRAEGKDPDLSPAGQARARNLGALLHRAGIGHVFSTPTARTTQTAQAVAARSGGLAVQTYDPRAPQALVAQVRALDGVVLVVGHSNTLPELVRLFGGAPGTDIADNEYDRVYQLQRGADGALRTTLFTSLPETGPAP